MIGEVLFGRYRVDSLHSSDVHGCVWQGADLHALAPVTIKMWSQHDRERALLEGEAMAALRHEGVVRLVDFGLVDGRHPCLVMESLEGQTLAERLAEVGTLPWTEAFALVAEVLDGLAALHDEGLIHRNVCPEHIVLRSRPKGGVKLVGLGRVGFVTPEPELPAVHEEPIGPLAYMPPEQVAGVGARTASDLYSLGLVLWEAISGQRPFEADPHDVAARVAFHPDFDALPEGAPELPVTAKLALDRMLDPSPQQREGDARACARRLRMAVGIEAAPRPQWLRAVG
ncbi:MAG: serine/threonine protein kinase [Myxococcales bacterium]|nr:serine/threonine protein kinase [Myxococcales bacterium]MCB9715766.1 serine/threonine protein kinase [Myxococcales bacterium]